LREKRKRGWRRLKRKRKRRRRRSERDTHAGYSVERPHFLVPGENLLSRHRLAFSEIAKF
jgi:hypothetical protein